VRRVERSAVVAAPPDDVFAYVSELDNLPNWQTGIVDVRRTSDGLVGVGASAVVVRELMGQRIEAPLKITAYDPPRRLTVQGAVSGVVATATLDLASHGQDTTVRFAMEISASGFTAFMEPMIAAAAVSDLEASLGRLQQHFSPAAGA
jgi:carbon monoxide dehydrogenase subunit G